MVRTKQAAADYIERHDGGMRIILAELVESAGKINLSWTCARKQAREHPEDALETSLTRRFASTTIGTWSFLTACGASARRSIVSMQNSLTTRTTCHRRGDMRAR